MSKQQDADYVRLDAQVEPNYKTINVAERSVEFIMSTTAVDSYGEIVVQDWDLSAYEKNPVLLYGHNWYGRSAVDSLPIGHMEDVGVVKGKLRGRAFFVTEKANPMGELVWNCVVEKALRAGSVGFRTTTVTTKKIGERELVYLRGNILKEFSITPIGANPDAVALGERADAVETKAEQFSRLAARAERGVPESRNDQNKGNVMEEELKKELDALRQRAAEQDAVIKKAADEAAERVRISAESDKAKAQELEAERVKLAAESDRLKAENEALRAKAHEARVASVKAEASALIGKQLVPAQVDHYVALAMSDDEKVAEAFKAFMAELPDLKITTPKITGENLEDGQETRERGKGGLSLVTWAQSDDVKVKEAK